MQFRNLHKKKQSVTMCVPKHNSELFIGCARSLYVFARHYAGTKSFFYFLFGDLSSLNTCRCTQTYLSNFQLGDINAINNGQYRIICLMDTRTASSMWRHLAN